MQRIIFWSAMFGKYINIFWLKVMNILVLTYQYIPHTPAFSASSPPIQDKAYSLRKLVLFFIDIASLHLIFVLWKINQNCNHKSNSLTWSVTYLPTSYYRLFSYLSYYICYLVLLVRFGFCSGFVFAMVLLSRVCLSIF